MKVGDLVKYRDSGKYGQPEPLALIIEVRSADSDYHKRIKVMWIGEKIPLQAQVISTKASRFSSWCATKHFEIVNES
jgi:hypothetical protein